MFQTMGTSDNSDRSLLICLEADFLPNVGARLVVVLDAVGRLKTR
jgi:hypothetical protein